MGNEQYIHGKKDDGKHDGKRANIRHMAESEEEIIEFWKVVWPELIEYVLHGVNWHSNDQKVSESTSCKEPKK